MGNQMIFKRYEIKYMLSSEQLSLLKQEMEKNMIADEHGKSTIFSCVQKKGCHDRRSGMSVPVRA